MMQVQIPLDIILILLIALINHYFMITLNSFSQNNLNSNLKQSLSFYLLNKHFITKKTKINSTILGTYYDIEIKKTIFLIHNGLKKSSYLNDEYLFFDYEPLPEEKEKDENEIIQEEEDETIDFDKKLIRPRPSNLDKFFFITFFYSLIDEYEQCRLYQKIYSHLYLFNSKRISISRSKLKFKKLKTKLKYLSKVKPKYKQFKKLTDDYFYKSYTNYYFLVKVYYKKVRYLERDLSFRPMKRFNLDKHFFTGLGRLLPNEVQTKFSLLLIISFLLLTRLKYFLKIKDFNIWSLTLYYFFYKYILVDTKNSLYASGYRIYRRVNKPMYRMRQVLYKPGKLLAFYYSILYAGCVSHKPEINFISYRTAFQNDFKKREFLLKKQTYLKQMNDFLFFNFYSYLDYYSELDFSAKAVFIFLEKYVNYNIIKKSRIYAFRYWQHMLKKRPRIIFFRLKHHGSSSAIRTGAYRKMKRRIGFYPRDTFPPFWYHLSKIQYIEEVVMKRRRRRKLWKK